MLNVVFERFRQGHRTSRYPAVAPTLPDRFRGLPVIKSGSCREGCEACVRACPTQACMRDGGELTLDLGRCLFCGECTRACADGVIAFSKEHRLAAREREALVVRGGDPKVCAAELAAGIKKLFGRSLKLRQVSAGGCNACEADINVLGTPGFDLGRFGIQVVASPRHADGLLITGPVTEHMKLALEKTYKAVADPKVVIAVGSCAIAGGPFAGHAEVGRAAAADIVPVDVFIPGCPPNPFTILDGLLRMLGRIRGQ